MFFTFVVMKEVDYIVVGCGLAGIAFCEQLKSHGKSYVVFDDQSQQSSVIAAGLYNGVILKRFTEVWKAKEQLQLALAFYKSLAEKFQVKIDYTLPIYRRFASIQEQNEWFTASDKPNLAPYLSAELIKNENPSVIAPLGFGMVLQTGKINTRVLLKHYKENLQRENRYLHETFNYENLNVGSDSLNYKHIKAKYILFAEGFGMLQNPFFKELPMKAAKGEIIIIKAPELNIDFILKSSIYIIPEGNHLYSVGATYNWKDMTHQITESAKEELVNQLKAIVTCDFEVVNQVAAIRPTVKDRRPMVGVHANHKNIALLNGLGTRGVMLAPYLAKQLFEHLEHQQALDHEIDIKRFDLN